MSINYARKAVISMDLTGLIIKMTSDADFRSKCVKHGMFDLFNNYVIDNKSGKVMTRTEYKELERRVMTMNYFMNGLDFMGQAVRA